MTLVLIHGISPFIPRIGGKGIDERQSDAPTAARSRAIRPDDKSGASPFCGLGFKPKCELDKSET